MFLEKFFGAHVDYSAELEKVKELIHKSDALLIGIGGGLSASGGLDYTNHRLVKKIVPDYHRMGYKNLSELQEMYGNIEETNAKAYWGYWSRVIKAIRYESEVGSGYMDLLRLIRNKDYFIYTTNQDGQLQRAGFDEKRVYREQGDYEKLQCKTPCCDKLYSIDELLDPMIKTLGGNLEIASNKIPKCPYCGNYLVPNIRISEHFVEPDPVSKEDYNTFIREHKDKKLVLLELGAGQKNEIKDIFERLTKECTEAQWVTVDRREIKDTSNLAARHIHIRSDLNQVIAELASGVVSF